VKVRRQLVRALRPLAYAAQQVRWVRLGALGWHSRLQRPGVITNPSHITIGAQTMIRTGARLEAVPYNGVVGSLRIDSRVTIENNVHIGAAASVTIGADTVIASQVTILDHDHGLPSKGLGSVLLNPLQVAPVTIGRGVWIGEKATILKGVTIGDGAVIGAGAVVTRDVPAWGIAVGVPATTIRVRADTVSEDGAVDPESAPR
jgi:acetyltransferase-like isoleucine patch superfamily enzyme